MNDVSRRNFGTLAFATGIAGVTATQASAGGTSHRAAEHMAKASVIETVRFQTNANAEADVFAEYLNDLAAYMGRYNTLVHRTVAHDGEGNWLLTNYWTDRAAMDRVNSEFQTQPPENDPGYFQEYVEFSTMSLAAFNIAKPK